MSSEDHVDKRELKLPNIVVREIPLTNRFTDGDPNLAQHKARLTRILNEKRTRMPQLEPVIIMAITRGAKQESAIALQQLHIACLATIGELITNDPKSFAAGYLNKTNGTSPFVFRTQMMPLKANSQVVERPAIIVCLNGVENGTDSEPHLLPEFQQQLSLTLQQMGRNDLVPSTKK